MDNVLNITIIETEDKLGQKGPYLRVQTDKNWMSAFEEEVVKLLKENKGNIVSVETTHNGPYTNIVKFLGVVKANPNNPEPKITNAINPMPENYLTNEEIAFVRKLKKVFE